jgi:hypothetical protein
MVAETQPVTDLVVGKLRRVTTADLPQLLAETGEALIDSGLTYGDGEPVLVSVRKREHRIDIDDRGRGAEKAGKPPGWLALAQEVVERDYLNVNRAGVVFVGSFEGRELDSLVRRVADRSLAVYEELLDLVD